MPKVSVIIPVYNAEKYIEKCARSLFEQTLDDIEYIFIDDCGRDQSIKILNGVLDDYPLRKTQVRILSNETNIGVGQSRQRGIDYATGDYLIHCDPDDWVDLDMYETMYHTAIQENSDVVICNYVNETPNGSEIIDQCHIKHKSEFLPKLVEAKFHMSLCNKLIKRELAKGERIPVGVNLWEDMAIAIPMLLKSAKTTFIQRNFYHYRYNPKSIVHSRGREHAHSKILAVSHICEKIEKHNLHEFASLEQLNVLKLRSKERLLILAKTKDLRVWRDTFPESHSFIYQSNISLGSKILSRLAISHLDFIVIVISTIYQLYVKLLQLTLTGK